VLSSVADTAVVPLQDLLGLGTEARMNLPNSTTGNWTWRFITPDVEKLRDDSYRAPSRDSHLFSGFVGQAFTQPFETAFW
jgi:4-alpha-glucanotransferase